VSEKLIPTAEGLEAKYGLPEVVVFCKRCVMSNQRPNSSVEFKHTSKYKHKALHPNIEIRNNTEIQITKILNDSIL